MSMIASAWNTYHDWVLLQKAYEIGKFIQERVSEDVLSLTDQPWGCSDESFKFGPHPQYDQTKTGLVLEQYRGMSFRIHTPYGYWPILSCGFLDQGLWEKVMQVIQKTLGLEMIQKGEVYEMGYVGPFHAITQWKDQTIEAPAYREYYEYISSSKVEEIWRQFAAAHEL
jgi:hypothetical protein